MKAREKQADYQVERASTPERPQVAMEWIGDSIPFDDPEPEPDILEVLLQALIGVRMLAQVEARMGQGRWRDALPLLDDVIERGTAVLHAKSCVIP